MYGQLERNFKGEPKEIEATCEQTGRLLLHLSGGYKQSGCWLCPSIGNRVLYLHWCFNVISPSTLLHCNGEVFSLESIGLSFAITDVFIFRQIIEI
jgi:hypothetical protein